MALLKDTIINGNLNISNSLSINGILVDPLLPNEKIAENLTADKNHKIVTAKQVKEYIESVKGVGKTTLTTTNKMFTPIISKNSITNITTGDITITKPNQGYYIAVQSDSQNAVNISSAQTTISQAGWFPKDYDFGTPSIAAGLAASKIYYIPVATAVRTGSSNPLAAGQSCSISAGYLPSTINITTKTLAEQTQASLDTAGSAINKTYYMAKNQTAWKNGVLYTGEAEVYKNVGIKEITKQDDTISFHWGLYYNGFTVKAHINDAIHKNGYVIQGGSGYIQESTHVYHLEYDESDPNHKCVDFIFE